MNNKYKNKELCIKYYQQLSAAEFFKEMHVDMKLIALLSLDVHI